jgi:hypothetical protein
MVWLPAALLMRMSRPLVAGREAVRDETADAIEDEEVTSRGSVSMPCSARADNFDGVRAVA